MKNIGSLFEWSSFFVG